MTRLRARFCTSTAARERCVVAPLSRARELTEVSPFELTREPSAGIVGQMEGPMLPIRFRVVADTSTQRSAVSGRRHESAARGDMGRSWKTLATHLDRLVDQLLDENEVKRHR